MSITRRFVLKAFSMALFYGLTGLLPRPVNADRPVAAFSADSVEATLRALFGTADVPASDRVRITVASLAENGAVVPIKLETELTGVRSITIIASRNPVPLVARFELGGATHGFVATRIKLAETSEVVGVVETREGVFLARKRVEVTRGGCVG